LPHGPSYRAHPKIGAFRREMFLFAGNLAFLSDGIMIPFRADLTVVSSDTASPGIDPRGTRRGQEDRLSNMRLTSLRQAPPITIAPDDRAVGLLE
jgi:hypothetical protein